MTLRARLSALRRLAVSHERWIARREADGLPAQRERDELDALHECVVEAERALAEQERQAQETTFGAGL